MMGTDSEEIKEAANKICKMSKSVLPFEILKYRKSNVETNLSGI